MKMIFNNKDEQKTVEKFLNNHLIDFLTWANREEKDLSTGDISLAEINEFTRHWIAEFNEQYIRKQEKLNEL